ncbi:HEPN/Toprim-associated domain-containing protein [Sphingobacterium hotanense]|uniref:HEPN/Toprim-associated domain-containing protein n=1 Tax=Sphingobacterium hotanense TaxID=649196 RepID=UPI0021A2DC10|nr:HEPN/Toprim-associated domain-containing protein [Sphingobacterium hotanense]MCT1525656.1 HEPN/Toprim-associated domain-containing protein [Sphingobacterium hotanense]
MGSYCELYLDSYQIDTTKSYINPFWSCIFKERDRISRQVHFSKYYTEAIFDTDLVPTNEYCSKVSIIKKRLELLGYTLFKVKEHYIIRLKEQIEEAERDFEEYPFEYLQVDLKHFKRLLAGGFDYWVEIVREIMFDRKLQSWDIERGQGKDEDICIWAVDNEDMFLGFPEGSYGYFLRAVLEAADDRAELRLDITSLVYAGYYAEDESVCENTAKGQINSSREFEKIILLTEGSTDSAILSRSLNVLYSELSDYFSLMDFGSTKSEGGSSALERTVKSFAAAGINNKIIAIFDNDAAGQSAIKRLRSLLLPSNIRVIPLPVLQLGKNYPTTGPQGNTMEDINGRACSIELYLGEDVLFSNGKLIPVVWKAFEPKVNAYQGEIAEKDSVQNRFYQKLKEVEKNGLTEKKQWHDLQSIFESIFQTAGDM